MRASPPLWHRTYPRLIAFSLCFIFLVGCARQTPTPPAPPTLSTTGNPTQQPIESQQAFATPAPTDTPSHTARAEMLSSATSTPISQPGITYMPQELVHDLAWSPDGNRLAVSAGDWVHIYEAATLEELQSLYTGAWAVDLDYQLGDILALADKDGSLQFWDTRTGSLICRMHAHEKGANSLDIDPSGRLLASAGNDAILRLWDLAPLIDGNIPIPASSDGGCGLQVQAEMIGGAFAVPAVRFSPDGALVASVDIQVLRLRDPLTQLLERSLYAENSLFDIAFSPDGSRLASAELGNQVRLWEVNTGEVLHTLVHNEGPNRFIWRVTFSPDGGILAAGSSDGTITLWGAASGELLHTILAHSRAVTALEFSPDGHWLASGSLDAGVKLWEMEE